ncbi:MAG: InlB B-repeat-containing protein [Christensenellaceae bacterium]|nr:InlB B-repeat-containing protein [Christensenellaceae bacterium]
MIQLRNVSNVVVEDKIPEILFNYNGGGQLIPSKSAPYNEPFGTLPTPTKANAEFVGWNTEPDGTGEYLGSSTLFLFLDDITLYAQYNDLLLVYINPNYGGGAATEQAFQPDAQVYNQLSIPSRQGWAFDGWFTNSLCTVPLQKATTAQEINDNYSGTVYAKWLQEIEIHFNITESGSIINNEPASALNNYQAPASGQDYVVRVSERPLGNLPTAAPAPANSAYYFGGWYENLADTSTLVAATTIYEYGNLISGQITLTSRWNTNAFLEYNLMGGDGIDECSPVWDGLSYEAYAGGNGTQVSPFQIANAKQLRQMARDINANTSANPINKTAHFILTNNIDLGGFAWAPIGTGSGSGANISRFEGNFNGNGFYIKNLNVSNALTAGTVPSKNFMGLFGAAYNATISRVGIESGQIMLSVKGTATFPSATKIYAGSVVGYCAGATVVDQCYNNASITVDIDRAVNVNDVEAYVGGLIGRLDDGSYEGYGSVAGGSTFKDSYNNGPIISHFNYLQNKVYNFVGGIIGYVYRSDFLNVFNMANVDIKTVSTNSNSSSLNSTIAFAGGICGEINSRGTLTNCFNTGSVSAICYASGSGGGDKRSEVGGVVAHLNNTISADSTISINGCKNYGNLTLTTDSNSQAAGGGRDLGGIIGLIVGSTSSPAVTGSKNFYKSNINYYGICSYNNGSNKTTSSNGNNLVTGTISLSATPSNSVYGTGDFEFTKTSYFYDNTYFNNTSGSIKWDFQNIWEFRLDRNDNLPMLKYMSYLTEYNSGVVTPNRKYVYTGERVGRLITPTRTGYIFSGWWNVPVEFDPLFGGLAYNGTPALDGQNGFIQYIGKDPNSLSDTNSTIFQGVDNIQIYAGWIPVASAITVTLHNISGSINQNTGFTAPSTIQAYQNYELRQLYTPQKDGYAFMGWYTAGNVQYFNTTIYETALGIDLYAMWQANNYIITLDANGGYVPRNTYEVTFDAAVGMLPMPYYFGRTFMGWQAPDTSMVDDNTIYSYPNNITLTAVWQINTYEITFDNNSGSINGTVTGTMANQSFVYGQTQQLSANTYSLDGYEFAGWALTPGAGGSVVYAPDANYTMSTEGNKTLFAVWKAKTYFVRMDTQGGSVLNPNNLIREGAVGQRIPLPAVTKAGFDLVGWYIVNGGGSDILVTNTYMTIANSDISVYCVWTEKQFYISFNRNDSAGSTGATGIDPTGQIAQVSNPIASLSSNTYLRDGYTFGGWTLTPNGPAIYQNNAALSITQQLHEAATGAQNNQITLYAVWNPIPFTVSFYSNAAAIGRISQNTMEDQTFYFDATIKINQNEFTITGFTFIGWATSSQDAAAGILTYTPEHPLTLTSPLGPLYAVWTKTVFEIEFRSGNQVWGATQSIIFEGASAEILLSNPFTKTRNIFAGWAFEPNSNSWFTELQIEEAEALLANSNNVITLYAIWAPKTYNLIVYKDSSMSEFITIENVKYGEPTAYDSSVFQKTGYDFSGLSIGGSPVVSSIGFIVISETYFNDEFTETPKVLVAMHDPMAVEITGISQTSITYKQQTTLTVIAVPDIGGLTFSITSGNVSINPLTGEITLTAPNMSSISFTVLVQHTNGTSDSETFTITINKRVITISGYDNDFTYNGLTQNIGYTIDGKVPSDLITTNISTDNPFQNAGTYIATVSLAGGWESYYEFDESCEFEVVIKQKALTITGGSFNRKYYTDNPVFTSTFSGFVNGENETNLFITVEYSTLASKQSRVGTYVISQNILLLQNYSITYQNGTLEVLPATLTDASVNLQVGESGYVEGGKLYFNISDIDFGTDGEFTYDDYIIVWEWSSAPDGLWTVIGGENTNQLILTKYKLGMEVSGLYFRVRLIGTGNISSSENITSEVNISQKIQPPVVIPPLSQNVLITSGVLIAFALSMILVAIISIIRSKLLIKRIKSGN